MNMCFHLALLKDYTHYEKENHQKPDMDWQVKITHKPKNLGLPCPINFFFFAN